ncbi:MAG: hypothetical protein GY832_36795 [Chloroflexi bacterium]|nr:hypothetical protein [Chloroflexota bacterium]
MQILLMHHENSIFMAFVSPQFPALPLPLKWTDPVQDPAPDQGRSMPKDPIWDRDAGILVRDRPTGLLEEDPIWDHATGLEDPIWDRPTGWTAPDAATPAIALTKCPRQPLLCEEKMRRRANGDAWTEREAIHGHGNSMATKSCPCERTR